MKWKDKGKIGSKMIKKMQKRREKIQRKYRRYLVKSVVSSRVPARLQGIVRQVEAGHYLLKAVPRHHIRHHGIPERTLPVQANVGHGNHTHINEYSNRLPDFLLADWGGKACSC
jgi:hypothetical protein